MRKAIEVKLHMSKTVDLNRNFYDTYLDILFFVELYVIGIL